MAAVILIAAYLYTCDGHPVHPTKRKLLLPAGDVIGHTIRCSWPPFPVRRIDRTDMPILRDVPSSATVLSTHTLP